MANFSHSSGEFVSETCPSARSEAIHADARARRAERNDLRGQIPNEGSSQREAMVDDS